MCGIAGYIGKKGFSKKKIDSILNIMKSRGPNFQDYFKYKNKKGLNINLFSSRLSIIDLNIKSNQPFIIKNFVMVYNGEIYNYLELKKKLEIKGIKFITQSDTEVVLRYYMLYGKKCLDFFEGMWSFAIYNTNTNKIFLSRDRFGEKPLHFLQTNDGFYFGSEINYIKNLYSEKIEINKDHLLNYLTLGYKSLYKYNDNFYKKIKQIPHASYVDSYAGNNFKIKKYWKLNISQNKKINIKDAIKITKEKVIDSIKLRLRSDVPIALCLSGGIDSSIIAAVCKKIFNKDIKTFSIIDNDSRYNEKKNINRNINDLKCEHEFVNLKKNNNLNRLTNLIKYRSSPVATISYYNHSLMLEKMNHQGFKVGLLGTAADEIFAGYYDHFLLHLHSIRNEKFFDKEKNFFLKYIQKFIRNDLLRDPEKYIKNRLSREHIFDESKLLKNLLLVKNNTKFIENKFSNELLRNRMLNELFFEITPVILNEDDLNSMNYSIENRSPYLDKNLVEFVYSLPSKYLIKNGHSKYLLREAFKGILNEKIRTDRKKIGFNSSIDSIFNVENKTIQNFLFDKKSEIYDLVDRKKIIDLFSIKSKPNYLSKFLFNFINAKIFLDIENKNYVSN